MNITLSYRAAVKLALAFTLYLTALFASNTLGLKTMPFLFDSHLTVGIFYFPFVFLMTDIVGEVYGKKVARLFVLGGFASILLFLIFSALSLILPWSDASEWAHESYNTIFGISIRISIASVIAYMIAEYQDVVSFFFFKRKFAKEGTRLFWLRSNLSNLWSQFLDTAIFMLIAFAGVYSWEALLSISISFWLYKVGMGALYTPLSYVGVWALKDDRGLGDEKHAEKANK